MATSSLPTFLDALATALAARPGLAGVNVFTCPVPPESLGAEGIELAAETLIEQLPAAMGSSELEESYQVRGSVLVAKPIVGATSATASINTAAKAARDRCAAIIEEVTDELATNSTMTATVRDVGIVEQTYHQGLAPEAQLGRVCWVEFTLAVEAHVTP